MDEKAFLDRWQKSLGIEVDFTEIEERHARKRKEDALLENINNQLLKLTVPQLNQVKEVFEEPVAIFEEPMVTEEVIMEMGRQPEPELPKDDIINKTVKKLSATPQKDIQKVADSLPDGIQKELNIIKKSIADFHRFAQRHSQMAGGGEVNLRYLDDVDRSSITNNYYLKYDAPTKKFVFHDVTVGVLPAGSNTQILFNGNTDVVSSANFTYNSDTSTLTVSNNVTTNNINTFAIITNTANVYALTTNTITFTGDNTVQNTAYIPAAYDAMYYAGANIALSSNTSSYVVPVSSQYDGARSISVGANSTINFAHSGKYIVNFSIQFESSDNSQADIYVWLKRNGADIVESSSIFTINARKSTGSTSKIIAVSPIFISANAGDNVQIMTASPESTLVSMVTVPARTNPTAPAAPAVIVTVQELN